MASSQEQETKDAASIATSSGHGPPPGEIAQAIEAAKTAASFQDAADSLKKKASLVWDPAERERLLRSAYEKEKAAHGESKKARIMASGWGQGAGLGAGISAAVGMGAGNLVGALLSGVVAIPGVLIGSGVGAIHGPFVKLKDAVSGNGKKAEEGEKDIDEKLKAGLGDDTETETDEDVKAHAAIVEAARELDDEKAAEVAAELKGARDDASHAGEASKPSMSRVEQSSLSGLSQEAEKETAEWEASTSVPSATEAENETSKPGRDVKEHHHAVDNSDQEATKSTEEADEPAASPCKDKHQG